MPGRTRRLSHVSLDRIGEVTIEWTFDAPRERVFECMTTPELLTLISAWAIGLTWRVASTRWNHNIHYHRVILDVVPTTCERALDIGCGEGMLTRQLREVVPSVVGIDLDEPSIELAGRQPAGGLDYVVGDVLTYPFEPASFDLIASVAALHHLDTADGLRRMDQLLRPGGTLAVVGLARSTTPPDRLLDLVGAISSRRHRLSKTYWEHSAPIVWPPPDSYGQTRDTARRLLPGVGYRRHVVWRYSLVWVKPG